MKNRKVRYTQKIELTEMTQELARDFFSKFENDPYVYEDPSCFKPYVYNQATADTYWERQKSHGRIHLAVMLENRPVGEIILKNLKPNDCCTLSIHLQSDSVKNQGIGTQAEILALEYAFHTLQIKTVYADALIRNARSCHVLEKAGFKEIRQDGTYRYYQCERSNWHIL